MANILHQYYTIELKQKNQALGVLGFYIFFKDVLFINYTLLGSFEEAKIVTPKPNNKIETTAAKVIPESIKLYFFRISFPLYPIFAGLFR